MSYNFPEKYTKCESQYRNIIKNEHDEDWEISEEVKTILNDVVEKEE